MSNGCEPSLTSGGTAGSKITSFMSRVVPWPEAGAPGVINLHWTFPKFKGMGGRPFRLISNFMNMAQWGASKPTVMKDIYFCLSQQSKTKPPKDPAGNERAMRHADDALALRAIWFDIDVKPDKPEKAYVSKKEVLSALNKFCADANVPPPTAGVFSGGGLHAYWISDRPLTVDEWQPFAEGLKALAQQHGLKCDYGLTTDAARVLRVPGTFNYKTDPPKGVKLAWLLPQDYDFAAALAHIRVAVAPRKITAAVTPVVLAEFPQRQRLPGERTDSLADGIETHAEVPLDPMGIIKGCPFFQDAALTHGKDHDQPLWHMTVFASTFWDKGLRWARYLSKGYPGYKEDETDAMFERKMAERKAHNYGWPSCKAFEDAGCKNCATCPLKGTIKSPLNLAGTAQPQQSPPTQPCFVDPYADFAGPAFPVDVLPPTLAKLVDAEHRAMGADPSAIAMALLTIVAGAIHGETRVQAGEGWWERPIIWTALIGLPSTMKSPIINKAKSPLAAIDQERNKRWKQEYAIWQQQNHK